jgi:hypothetical protein
MVQEIFCLEHCSETVDQVTGQRWSASDQPFALGIHPQG